MNTKRYCQYYTPKILTEKYINLFHDVKNRGERVVDPFVGEGDLLLDYLFCFSHDEIQFILNNKLIKGYDIDKNNIIKIKNKFNELFSISYSLLDELFEVRNSFKRLSLKKNDFIITNPPYLARNVCKKTFPKEYKRNFLDNEYNDYFEIALNRFKKYNGLWIIPTNFFSSELFSLTRNILMKNHEIDDIFVFESPIFKETRISVTSFHLNNKNKKQTSLLFNFVKSNNSIISKDIDITYNGILCSEWFSLCAYNAQIVQQGFLRKDLLVGTIPIDILNEDYQIEQIYVNQEQLKLFENNILYLRSVDTGSESGCIGLYTIDELYPNLNHLELKTLLTKKTSRACVPLFFNPSIGVDLQIKIKDEFNKLLLEYRNRYNSLFLTNFKNANQRMIRKRISFKEAYGLISYVYQNIC